MNQVYLIGNLGKDLERKEVGGKAIARGTLATRRNKETTDWHNITIWGKAAETALEYCKKGSRIACVGSINYSTVEKDGQKRTYTEINVNQIELLTSKAEAEAIAGAASAGDEEETAEEFLDRMKEEPKSDLPF